MFDPLPCVGKRTAIRRFSLDDLEAFQVYRHDVEIGRYQGWFPQTDEEAAEFLGHVSGLPLFPLGDWIQLAIVDRESGLLIGDIGLCVDGEVAEIGFTLRPESQGQGLATEAVGLAIRLVFDSTLVVRIVGISDARNLPSIRLLERLGMIRIATAPSVFRGEECIEHTYSLSRRDWIARS